MLKVNNVFTNVVALAERSNAYFIHTLLIISNYMVKKTGKIQYLASTLLVLRAKDGCTKQ